MTINVTAEQKKAIQESVKEVFTVNIDGKTQHIAIVEQPQDLADHHGLTIDLIEQHHIDGRILTVMMTIFDHKAMAELVGYYVDHMVIVYDYKSYCANPYIKEALTAHELGHIMYPTGHLTEVDEVTAQEFKCDEYAVQQCGKESVLLMLNILRAETIRIGSNHLVPELEKRIINIKRLPDNKALAPAEKADSEGLFSSLLGKIKNLFA